MEVKTLYRYTDEVGRTVISLVQPECEYTEMLRLIADTEKALTKDYISYLPVIDITPDDKASWYEVDAPVVEEPTMEMISEEDFEMLCEGEEDENSDI